MPEQIETSPYALGFQTLRQEVERSDLAVQGELPEWLHGVLLRTGPALFEVGGQTYRHWFDGLAMLHGFYFDHGTVGYSNRFLHGRSYLEARQKGRISRHEFATDPCYSLFGKMVALFSGRRATDNGNVNVEQLGGRLVAMTETTLPVEFDPETFEALSLEPFVDSQGDESRGQITTAHPHYDSERNLHYNCVVALGRQSRYRLFSIDAETGMRRPVVELPIDRPAYLHSFAMTRNYLIVCEFPFVVNPLRLRFGLRPFIENYRWQPERGTRIHVVDKTTGEQIGSWRTKACFAFHHVHAWEAGSRLLVDLIAYPDPGVIEQLYLDRLRSAQPTQVTGRLSRIEIDLENSRASDTIALFPKPVELPSINGSHCAGSDYRFAYFVGNNSAAERRDFLDCLIKADMRTGGFEVWQAAETYPGEPVFVPHPQGVEENDGIVLSVVLDVGLRRSFLLALDARSWRELGRVYLPHAIPLGFHGRYFDNGLAREKHLT